MPLIISPFTFGPPPPTYAFQATTTDPVGRTTYTFASQNIGAASATRNVVVAVLIGSTSSRTISSVTIGGVTATVVPNGQAITQSFFYRLAFYVAAVPAGTTASIVVTASGACNFGSLVGVWALYDLSSPVAVDSDGVTVAGTNTLNVPSVNTSAGGPLLAASAYYSTTGATSQSWTNATERSDVSTLSAIPPFEIGASAADANTSGAGIAVSVAMTGGVDAGLAIAAAFR